MSIVRLASITSITVLLVACAGWESSTPSYAPPPEQAPTPSQYAPPPPDAVPTPPTQPAATDDRVAIASVQLLDDCPEPTPAAQQKSRSSARPSPDGQDIAQFACAQSTVQLSVQAAVAGSFRIEAVRVLDAASKRSGGTARLREPTRWDDGTGTYMAWDERTVAGTDLKISYKLGDQDLSRASELVGPDFNTYAGPFILEMDVSIAGQRRTIRSSEYRRELQHVMVT